MDKKAKLVLEILKPKASSLGFTKEELEGAAERIASNLTVADDATEEEMKTAAEKSVEVFLPFLEQGQKTANRIIQKNKEEREKAEAEAKKKAEEEAAKKAAEEAAKKAEEERKAREEEERKKAEQEGLEKFYNSEWARNMRAENERLAKQLDEQKKADKKRTEEFESFREEFRQLKADRVKSDRAKKLDEVIKDSGVFGERIKKNYAKMSFATDEEFDEFIGDVQKDLRAFNQERADKGLEQLGAPAAGGTQKQDKVEPYSKEEIDALADIM